MKSFGQPPGMSLFVSFFLHSSVALLACIFGDDQCIRVIIEKEEAIMFLWKSCNRCGADIEYLNQFKIMELVNLCDGMSS